MAMTRAQLYLVSIAQTTSATTGIPTQKEVMAADTLHQTMSYSQFRMMGGEENNKTLSEFVGLSQKKTPVSLSSCATLERK